MFRICSAGSSTVVAATTARSSATLVVAHRGTVEAIRTRCLEKGWDLRELARRAGVSRTTLHHLLSGATRRPHIATVSRLAAALGIRVDQPSRAAAVPPVGAPSRPALAGSSDTRTDFDRRTNPAINEVCRTRPHLFGGWSGDEWDELYSTFGVGGNLSADGVVACAEAINDRRETTRKLHLVLETHLAGVAKGLVETLYGMICPAPDAPIADVAAPGVGGVSKSAVDATTRNDQMCSELG